MSIPISEQNDFGHSESNCEQNGNFGMEKWVIHIKVFGLLEMSKNNHFLPFL